MQTQPGGVRSELAFKLLSEIAEAVIVTDSQQHVVYWNGSAERLFGLKTQEVLGRRLDVCCPELAPGASQQIQRAPPTKASENAPPPKDVVLWAEDDDNDASLLARAWQKAQVSDKLIRVRNGAEVISYLIGEGPYADRRQYPLPRLLLLDIKMPVKSGLDVIEWLQWQPQFSNLPVVILTSSSASTDIQEAARLRVKGYLVKPLDVAEWVLKVRTVTSQCQ